MQSVQSSQAEIGLSSITDILSNISFGTNTGNDFLHLLSKDFFNFKESTAISLVDITSYVSKKYDIMKNVLLSNEMLNYQLDDITVLIEKFTKNKQISNDDSNINKYLKFLTKQDNNTQLNSVTKSSPNETNDILSNLLKSVDNIFKKITGTSKEPEKKEIKKDDSTSGIFDGIGKFAESLIIIKKNLTSRLTKNVTNFLKSFNDTLTNSNKQKIKVFGESMEKFGELLVDLDKKITKPSRSIGLLALSFIGLSLAIISPTFVGSMIILGSFLLLINKYVGDKQIGKDVDKFGYGILALTGSLLLIQFVPWEAVGKLIVFIGGLTLALRFFNGPNNTGGDIKSNPMLMFAAGIGILTLSMLIIQFVPWEAIGKMIVFIFGLGIALKFFNGPKGTSGGIKDNPMVMFSLGIGLLTLSLLAFDEIPLASVFKMILFVGALGFIMSRFNFEHKGAKNSMVIFALGLGLFILAILAFDELPYEAMFKTIMFIGALGLTMKLFNFNRMGPANSMISFSFGFAIMVLAMYAMNELPYEAMFKTLLFLGGLGLVMKLFNGTSGLSFLLLSIGIIAISGALWIFKKIDWSITDALVFGATIAILAGVVALAGIPVISVAIGLGTLAITAMSIGLIITGLSLSAISNLPINHTNLLNFAISSGLLAVTFAAITPFAILGAVGAIAFLPIAASALIASIALLIISQIKNFDVTNFSNAVSNLTDTYYNLGFGVVGAALAAVAFLPIASISILTAIALRLISGLVINNTNLLNYGIGIKTLVNGINDLGGWDLAKTAAKSLLLVPVFGSALAGALVLRLISALDIDNNKVLGFGNLIITFTDTIASALSKNESKLSSAMPGINALAKLMSISGSLAKTIQLMANMQFYEYGVENGKLVLKGVRSLTSADFKRVGENLGTMLQCLIEPLTILGSNSNSFVIGGKVITNPFKSSTALKGIEMLAAVGNAFKPLAESIKTYASLPMVSNPELLNMFRDSLLIITQTYMWMFGKLSTLNPTIILSSISLITKFNDNFKNIDTKKIESLNTIFEKFVNNLSDDVKWLKIHNNLKLLGKQFQDVAKNINSIDIEKATLFERNVRNLVDKNNGENLRQAVESLAELLNMIKEQQEVIINTPTVPNPLGNPLGNPLIPTPLNKNPDKKLPTKTNNVDNDDTLLINALNGITSQLSGIAGKLSDTLKVRVTGGTINTIGG